jgi:hypothetical protein
MLMEQYPKARPEDIVEILIREFKSLTELPPALTKSTSEDNIIRQFGAVTISGVLFFDKK